MVQRRRQRRHDRVPAVRGTVPVSGVGRQRRWRRGRPEPGGRRRRRFVVIAVTVAQMMTGPLLVTVTAAGVLLFVVTAEIRGVVIVKIRTAGAGRHDVDRGRRQRRRYPAVRAVHRARRTLPMLGRRCPLSRRGDGRGGGSGAPRLVVVNVLVELHGGGGGGGTRSTDGNGRLRLRTEAAASRDPLVRLFVRSLAAAVSVSSGRGAVQTLAARKRIGQKCCFFHRTAETLPIQPPRSLCRPSVRPLIYPPPTNTADLFSRVPSRSRRSATTRRRTNRLTNASQGHHRCTIRMPNGAATAAPNYLGKAYPLADSALIRRASWTTRPSYPEVFT